jgi:hypothetical protein
MGAPQTVIEAPLHGDVLTVPWVNEVAPPAGVSLLVAIKNHMMHAITAPYAVTGLSFESGNAAGTRWHYAQRINLGARAMRGWFCLGIVPTQGSAEPAAIVTYSSSSGSAAADAITIPVGVEGSSTYPPGPIPAYPKSGEDDNTAPAATMDRMYEVFNTDALGVSVSGAKDTPYTEGFEVTNTHGAGGVLQFVADVSVL